MHVPQHTNLSLFMLSLHFYKVSYDFDDQVLWVEMFHINLNCKSAVITGYLTTGVNTSA